ncbi:hypothetical protein AMECASPLE_036264 [Ameca splendens]|uniref:Uncharacterized protein n=1 Tax=Ameca splendens TaxID=208324 RepID=A0ABV0ZHN7_9TELE
MFLPPKVFQNGINLLIKLLLLDRLCLPFYFLLLFPIRININLQHFAASKARAAGRSNKGMPQERGKYRAPHQPHTMNTDTPRWTSAWYKDKPTPTQNPQCLHAT